MKEEKHLPEMELEPARFWSRRRLGRFLFVTACLVTLVPVFYTAENWRGKRAWEQCRKELIAKGANLDWRSHIPARIPDEQNIFAAPRIAEWFIKNNGLGSPRILVALTDQARSSDLTLRYSQVNAELRAKALVAEVAVLSPGTALAAEQADVVVPCITSDLRTNSVARESIRRAVEEASSPLNGVGAGEIASLRGGQNYTFLARATNTTTPFHVVILATNSPTPKQISELFPRNLISVVAVGPGAFQVLLNEQRTLTARDYLDCTEALAPEFDAMREALQRASARMEGDYEHPWAQPIPNFVVIRNVALTLSQRAQCWLLLGQPDKALREMTLLHQISRLLENKPATLVSAMINVAITGLYSSIVGDGLRLHAWQEPQLAALQRQLGEIHLLSPVMQAFECERVASCYTLENVRTPDLNTIFAFGKQERTLWEKLTNPGYLLLTWMPRGWVYQNMATIASRNQFFLEAVDPTKNVVSPVRLESLSRETAAKLKGFCPYTFLAAAAVPNFIKATQTMAHNQTMVNEALLACALERYRLVHHEYPETLAALSPAFLEKIPVEIVNGQPLKYRRVDDRFLLYSVGWNLTDDGGVPGKSTPEGDWVWQAGK